MNGKTKNPNAVALGRLGGLAGRGDSKRRSKEQLSRAGKIGMAKRWGKPPPDFPYDDPLARLEATQRNHDDLVRYITSNTPQPSELPASLLAVIEESSRVLEAVRAEYYEWQKREHERRKDRRG